jgi:hypothetical protein
MPDEAIAHPTDNLVGRCRFDRPMKVKSVLCGVCDLVLLGPLSR